MRIFFYNRLRNARIKSTFMGLILTLLNVGLFFLLRGKSNGYQIILSTLPSLGLLIALSYVSFGQALEQISQQQFHTCYALGKFRWNVKTFEGPVKILITQDKDRYYALMLEHTHGKLSLEKHPVLSTANGRLEELKADFSSFIR